MHKTRVIPLVGKEPICKTPVHRIGANFGKTADNLPYVNLRDSEPLTWENGDMHKTRSGARVLGTGQDA